MSWAREFSTFGMIGIVGFVVDTAILYTLKGTLGLFLARVVSFLIAATTTWLLNRAITFKDRSSNLSSEKEFVSYMCLMLVGGLVNYASFVWLVLSYNLVEQHLFIGVAVGSLAGMLFNFLLARALLFRRQID